MRYLGSLALSLLALMAAPSAAVAQDAKTTQTAALMRPAVPPGTAGIGPLTLTASAAANYRAYFAHRCPQVLTVEAAGWAMHAALGDGDACATDGKKGVPEAAVREALNTCDHYAENRPCSVVAVGRKVVWDGPIRFLPGRYMPQGGNRFAVVLRKPVSEENLSSTYETLAGALAYAPDGKSADMLFQRDYELGQCRGGLTVHDSGTTTMTLSCTKIGAINGSFDHAADGRTGSGSGTDAAQRRYTLTVLPHAENIMSGNTLYAPPAEPAAPKMKSKKGGAS